MNAAVAVRTAPTVSVVMGVYNGVRHVEEAVASILGQTYSDLELIIIDDGSTDDTRGILHRLQDPRVRVCSQAHMGLTGTLNVGISVARGSLVARMDADDISHRARLERQVRFLERHPRVALVGTSYEVVDQSGRVLGFDRIPTAPRDVAWTLKNVGNCVAHGSIMVRKQALDEIGGYRPEFKYAQDYDLCLRLLERHEIANIPETLYRWRLDPRGITSAHYAEQTAFAALARALSRDRCRGGRERSTRERARLLRQTTERSRLRREPSLQRNLMKAFGVNYLLAGDRRRAFCCLAAALRLAPCDARVLALLATTLLPLRLGQAGYRLGQALGRSR